MLAALQARGCSNADASPDTGLLRLRAVRRACEVRQASVDVVHGEHDAEAA
jgi:hypothetical protein